MEDDLQKKLKSLISITDSHKKHLEELLRETVDAKNEVNISSLRAKEKIEEQFSVLKKNIMMSLEKRCQQLLMEVVKVKDTVERPIKERSNLITKKLELSSALLDEGHKYLKFNQNISKEQIMNLTDQSRTLLSLPDFPAKAQLCSIEVNFDPCVPTDISTSISLHGVTTGFSPVCITSVEEQPGAIVVRWNEVDDDIILDTTEYRLQYCQGDALVEKSSSLAYKDAYTGTNSEYTLRGVQINIPYSFRVCFHSGDGIWRPWSQPYVSKTRLPPYEWDPSNPSYNLTSEGKVATRLAGCSGSVLCSRTPVWRLSHSIIFKLLAEGGEASCSEGIALLDANLCNIDGDCIPVEGSILLNMDGHVFIDGHKMTTRLPTIHKGSSATFDIEPLSMSGKVRVTIEVSGKQVTYDWTTSEGSEKQLDMYFAMVFHSPNWKIELE